MSFVAASPSASSARIRRLGLVGNMSSSVIGSGVYSACQWCVLVAIAHLGSRTMLGQYALALAITTPVFALTSLNARAVQASDSAGDYPFGAYLSLRLVSTCVALVIVLISVTRWELTTAGMGMVWVVALAKAVDAVTECYYARLQQLEAMPECAAGAIVNGVLTLAVGATLLAVTGSIVWLAAGSLAASMATLMLVRRRSARICHALAQPAAPLRQQVVALAMLTLPMGVTAGLGAIGANLPHYFVQYHLGAELLGVWAALASVAMVADLLGAAALQAAVPRLARAHRHDRTEFARLAVRLAGACALGGSLLLGSVAVVGESVLGIAYGSLYQSHLAVLLCLTGATVIALTGAPLSAAATAARRLTDQIGIGLAGLAAGACAGTFLVPRFGLLGAALTMLVVTTTRFMGQLVVFRRCVVEKPATVPGMRDVILQVSR